MTNPRYQRGGDLYATLADQYGPAAADRAASAAAVDDGGTRLRQVLSDIRNGNTDADFSNRGFWGELGDQIYNRPLEAPIQQFGDVVKNTAKTIAGNWGMWIVVALVGAGVYAFFYFGGPKLIRRALV